MFSIIVFHLLYHDQPNAHVIIASHAIITIKNENTIIADINIFINHCTKIGKAVTLVTLVVSHLLELVFISIQSHINGTTVFNCIQQHFLDESQIHLVCSSFAIVPSSHDLHSDHHGAASPEPQVVDAGEQPLPTIAHHSPQLQFVGAAGQSHELHESGTVRLKVLLHHKLRDHHTKVISHGATVTVIESTSSLIFVTSNVTFKLDVFKFKLLKVHVDDQKAGID